MIRTAKRQSLRVLTLGLLRFARKGLEGREGTVVP
jgi:hypothetical protein